MPSRFLKSLGIRLENEWAGDPIQSFLFVLATLVGLWFGGGQTGVAAPPVAGWGLALAALGGLLFTAIKGSRWSWLGVAFLIFYTVYGANLGHGLELWPHRNWGFRALSFFDRPWSFWYTVLYTLLMTFFGLQALKRWGIDRRDKFQIWWYTSLLSFPWVFFFLIPEFLFKWAVEYRWVGERLASDPTFSEQAWRAYGAVYAWPLFFYTFFLRPAPGVDRLGHHPKLRRHPAVCHLPWEALLLVDLRLRRAGRNARGPLAPLGSERPRLAQMGADALGRAGVGRRGDGDDVATGCLRCLVRPGG